MPSAKPRVLILSLPLGGGHAAVASSLRRHLEASAPDRFDIHVAHLSDHVHVSGRPISAAISGVYQWTLETLGARPYRWLYTLADRHPSQISSLAHSLFGSRARTWLMTQEPDVVIATYPLVTYVVSRLLGASPVRVVSVVTDVGKVTRLWWAGQPETSIVMHAEVALSAVAAGVPTERILDLGMIVDPSITRAERRLRVTGSRGHTPFTILLAAGGQGFAPNVTRFVELVARTADLERVEFIVATGTNRSWAAKLVEQLGVSRSRIGPPVGMFEILPTVDLVIGKAGWATLAECFVAGVPVIVTDTIPGQEEENADFAQRAGLIRCLTPPAAVESVRRYAADPALLHSDFARTPEVNAAAVGSALANLLEQLLHESGRPSVA